MVMTRFNGLQAWNIDFRPSSFRDDKPNFISKFLDAHKLFSRFFGWFENLMKL